MKCVLINLSDPWKLGRAHLNWLRHKCLLLVCPYELTSGETVAIECEIPDGPPLSFEGRVGATLPLGVYGVKLLPSLDAHLLDTIGAEYAARLLARMIDSNEPAAPLGGSEPCPMAGDEKTVSEVSPFVADSVAVEMVFEPADDEELSPSWRRDTAAGWRALSTLGATEGEGMKPLVELALKAV